MVNQLRITVLSENTAGDAGILAEHGLSLWIEADGRKILFDTGQGFVLKHNAEKLGIDLSQAQSVVLSHGHYDHTAGLPGTAERLRQAKLYVHPSAFEAKYVRRDNGTVVCISIKEADMKKAVGQLAGVVFTEGPTYLSDDIWVTGRIPRRTDFEDTGGAFYLDQACRIDDPLVDDQGMCIDTPAGLVVILGCTHSGLVNTIEYIAEVSGRSRIHAVLGGMHLLHASPERVAKSMGVLRKYDVRMIGAAHCTGLRPVATFLNAWPDRFVHVRAGARLEIERTA